MQKEKAPTLSTAEAAEILGISTPSVIKLTKTGVLPYFLNGRNKRFAIEDVEKFREQGQRR